MEPKFLAGRLVRHIKTGNIYAVVFDPNSKLTIESTNQLSYAYVSVNESEPAIWVRPAREMEDGRFEYYIPNKTLLR